MGSDGKDHVMQPVRWFAGSSNQDLEQGIPRGDVCVCVVCVCVCLCALTHTRVHHVQVGAL